MDISRDQETMWTPTALAECLLGTPKGEPINEGLARDLARAVEGLVVRVAELEKERDEARANALVQATVAGQDAWREQRNRAEVAEWRVAVLEAALERIATYEARHADTARKFNHVRELARAALAGKGK
jgi:hypothetical protein